MIATGPNLPLFTKSNHPLKTDDNIKLSEMFFSLKQP